MNITGFDFKPASILSARRPHPPQRQTATDSVSFSGASSKKKINIEPLPDFGVTELRVLDSKLNQFIPEDGERALGTPLTYYDFLLELARLKNDFEKPLLKKYLLRPNEKLPGEVFSARDVTIHFTPQYKTLHYTKLDEKDSAVKLVLEGLIEAQLLKLGVYNIEYQLTPLGRQAVRTYLKDTGLPAKAHPAEQHYRNLKNRVNSLNQAVDELIKDKTHYERNKTPCDKTLEKIENTEKALQEKKHQLLEQQQKLLGLPLLRFNPKLKVRVGLKPNEWAYKPDPKVVPQVPLQLQFKETDSDFAKLQGNTHNSAVEPRLKQNDLVPFDNLELRQVVKNLN